MSGTFWVVMVLLLILVGLMWFAGRFAQSEFAYPMTSPPPSTQDPQTREDDLTVIEDIGPVLERVLKEAGIRTYRDLASKTPEELQSLLEAAGMARFHHPQTWPEQARLAAEGHWDALRDLQATLRGGVRDAA